MRDPGRKDSRLEGYRRLYGLQGRRDAGQGGGGEWVTFVMGPRRSEFDHQLER